MEEYKPSNPRIYKIGGPGEKPEQREKREEKLTKDVNDRLQMLAQFTGAQAFPQMNPNDMEKKVMIRLLVKAGAIESEADFEDLYYMEIDKRIQDLEAKKEDLKKDVEAQRAEIQRRKKGIHLPPGFKKGNKIIKA